MSVEFWCLYGAMVLGLVHMTAASFTFKAQVGNGYTVGARDEPAQMSRTGHAGESAANHDDSRPLCPRLFSAISAFPGSRYFPYQ